jgi:hypothetical protein
VEVSIVALSLVEAKVSPNGSLTMVTFEPECWTEVELWDPFHFDQLLSRAPFSTALAKAKL